MAMHANANANASSSPGVAAGPNAATTTAATSTTSLSPASSRPLPMLMMRRQQQRRPNGSGLFSNLHSGPAWLGPLRKSQSTQLWIGAGMFGLVLVYVAVVLTVTHSWADVNHSSSSSSNYNDLLWSAFRSSQNHDGTDVFQPHHHPGAVLQHYQQELLQHRQQQQQHSVFDVDKVQGTNDSKNKNEKNDPPGKSSTSLRAKLDQAKQQRAAEQRQQSNKKMSPIRKFHLEQQFGHGVDPHVLIPHDEQEAPDELPIAYKYDPPIENHRTPDHVLTAYLEPLHYEDWTVKPLPRRDSYAKALQLTAVSYPRLQQCSRLIQQWPVDDTPTDQDPFLPWIHDVFPTADGRFIQFVAQNKRRCATGKSNMDQMNYMQPQASLFQHISLKRIRLDDDPTTRYRLASHTDADGDAIATRFICRFKPGMEETLSIFNIDYDWTAYRKRCRQTFQEDDGGIKNIHVSQLLFKCPVPPHLQEAVRSGSSVVDDWATIFVDLIPIRTPPRFGSPLQYLAPWYELDGVSEGKAVTKFYPDKEWGRNHILPQIQDSGRWENIPICKPSLMTYEQQPSDLEGDKAENAAAIAAANDTQQQQQQQEHEPVKKHRLVSCLWASAGYTTRGNRFAVNDGQRRLLEWITYNKLIGFDHFYVYDNSGAFANDTSLKPIIDLFPNDVTYIPWPSQVCNNNPNNVESPGERSSQYAAESSCRLRFGPHVDWIGQFDIDEYLIPMGNHNNITSLLDELEQEDTRIISFGSWRAWPRWAHIDSPEPISDPNVCWHPEPCFQLTIPLNTTMLQAYNCDRQPPGQKTEQMPAEKQLYRADYVQEHFVHYSAATTLSEKNQSEYVKEGFMWKGRAFPDPRQRFANEMTEGLMVHTKAVAHQDTAGWQIYCHQKNWLLPKRRQGLCRLGLPWPTDQIVNTVVEDSGQVITTTTGPNVTHGGWSYNCFVNSKVEDYWVPRLKENLEQFSHVFDAQPQQGDNEQ